MARSGRRFVDHADPRDRTSRARARALDYGNEYPSGASESGSDLAARMGMHDFTEHYGRYSGGDPYGYEYSERTVEHRQPWHRGGTGFTRGLTRRREEEAYTREPTPREEAHPTRARYERQEEMPPAHERPRRRDRRRRPRGAPWAQRLHERRARRHGFEVRGYHEREPHEAREGRGPETAPPRREPRYGREYGHGREYGYGRESRPGRYPFRSHPRRTRPRQGSRHGRGQRWYEPRDPW